MTEREIGLFVLLIAIIVMITVYRISLIWNKH